jgi:Zn-dependent peptidase ImmA (M78 family)
MRRGFKSQAEQTASEIRTRLGCRSDEPVPLEQIAADLAAEMIAADQLVPKSQLDDLNDVQEDAFSAATFRLRSGRRVVVFNPLHSLGRTRSNQAHELAHIILQHTVRTIEEIGGLTFVTCDIEQEEEADWLAGCLLLPRDLLYREARRGKTAAEIADAYGTSLAMARFRLNTSGVLIQIGRAKSNKAQAFEKKKSPNPDV